MLYPDLSRWALLIVVTSAVFNPCADGTVNTVPVTPGGPVTAESLHARPTKTSPSQPFFPRFHIRPPAGHVSASRSPTPSLRGANGMI
jgi:hypothetical protein